MITYYTIITIVFFHWLFDFYFQTDEMAKNKSKSNDALMDHVMTYVIGLALIVLCNAKYFVGDSFSVFLLSMVWFVVINAVAHFVTDFTSRASSALYKEERYHEFFTVIGVDQMIHYITLFGTFIWLTNL